MCLLRFYQTRIVEITAAVALYGYQKFSIVDKKALGITADSIAPGIGLRHHGTFDTTRNATHQRSSG